MFNQIVSDTYIFNNAGGCKISADKDNLRGGMSLIESEMTETSEGITNLHIAVDDEEAVAALVEIADGAADVIVTAIGLLYRAGFTQSQTEDILAAVGKANKDKFDTSEEDAKKSVEMYKDDHRYFDVTYEKHGRRYAIIGKYASEDGVVRKILKSHKWRAPEKTIEAIIREEEF